MGSTFKVETNTTKDTDGKETTTSKFVMKRLYGFSDAQPSAESQQQKSTALNADSSAKPEDKTVQNKQVPNGNSEKKVENPIKKTVTVDSLKEGGITPVSQRVGLSFPTFNPRTNILNNG